MQIHPLESIRQEAAATSRAAVPVRGNRNLLVKEILAESDFKEKYGFTGACSNLCLRCRVHPTPGWRYYIYKPFVSRWFVKRCSVLVRRSPRCTEDVFHCTFEVSQQQRAISPSEACCRLYSPELQSACGASVRSAISDFSGPHPMLGLETAHKFSYTFHYIRNVHYTLLPQSGQEENCSHFFSVGLLKEKFMANIYNG